MQQPGSTESLQNNDSDSEENYEDNITFPKQLDERHSFYRSRRFIIMVALSTIIVAILILIIVIVVILHLSDNNSASTSNSNLPSDPLDRAKALLKLYPVIDGYVLNP